MMNNFKSQSNQLTHSGNDIFFCDLFDLKKIQHLQDLFAETHGVASIITQPDGTPITDPSNFTRLCKNIIRKTEKGCANCYKSNELIGRPDPTGPTIQPCLSGGLWDAGASISVGGKHIANWLIGQVQNDELDKKRILEYADEIGANKEEFINALDEVPVMSTEKFRKVAKMLFAFANELSEKAFYNLQIKQESSEREKAFDLLKKSEEKYRLITENTADSLVVLDLNLSYTFLSPAIYKLLGYTPEEMMNLRIEVITTPESWQMALQILIEELEIEKKGGADPKRSRTIILEQIRKDGQKIWVEATVSFVRDSSGHPTGIMAVSKDITERRLIEDSVRESEEKFRNIFAYSANGKSITTIGGKMKANNAFCQILGYTEDELNQLKWQDITHPESVENDRRILKSILSGEETSARWEKRYIRKNGSIIWVDINTSLHRDSAGNPLYFITSISDITAKKHVEDLLRDNESFLQEAQAIANLGAYNLDVKTGLWTSSALLDEIFGIDPDYVRSVEGWLPIIHPDWRETMMNYLLNEVLGNRAIFDKEYQIVRQNDKTVRWVHGRGRLKIDENNQVFSMLGTIQDITERKEAEILLNIKNDELLHAKEKAEESDRLKSAFLANMSHEIRTPLNSIIGFSELLNDQYFTEEQRAEFTRTIVDQGNNLLIIINDIMDLSMLESKQIILRKEKFAVSKLLNDLFFDFKTSAELKGIDFQVNIPSGCESIFLENDIYRIKQILNNFISNALKFTSQGYVLIGYSCNNDVVEFYVKDTGIGIPAKYHDSIFERFRQVDNTRTRKYGGNGLGLAISKNIAEILGGKIRVESEEGIGSTFYFSIPEYHA